MSVHVNPRIVTDGIVFELDAYNTATIYNVSRNLLSYPEDLSSWSLSRGIVITNTTTAPDGTLTADKFADTLIGASYIYQGVTLTVGRRYVFSAYAKPAGYTSFYFRDFTDAATSKQIDVSTGIISGVDGPGFTNTTATSVGSGWYRCSTTYVPPTTNGSHNMSIDIGTTDTSSDGTQGLYIWGIQLEVGSALTDYIPASATASTTWKDASTATNNATLINSSTYAILNGVKCVAFNGTTNYVQIGSNSVSLMSSTAYTKSIWVYFNNLTANNNLISSYNATHDVYMGGTATVKAGHAPLTVGEVVSATSLTTSSWWNVVTTFSTTSGFKIYINGVLDAANTTSVTAVSGTTDIAIGTYGNTSNLLNGYVAAASVYNRELSATEIRQNFNALRGRFGI